MRERKRDKNRLEDILKCIDNVRQFVRDIDLSEINWNEWEQGEDDYSEIDSDAYKQAVETAQRLKAMAKLSDEQIAQATGLTIKEVEELS
ncbi:MAG: hypothetical protein IJ929_04800 [Prevotella sp.]|nr:hypothetical protein [Prevotella sp.]